MNEQNTRTIPTTNTAASRRTTETDAEKKACKNTILEGIPENSGLGAYIYNIRHKDGSFAGIGSTGNLRQRLRLPPNLLTKGAIVSYENEQRPRVWNFFWKIKTIIILYLLGSQCLTKMSNDFARCLEVWTKLPCCICQEINSYIEKCQSCTINPCIFRQELCWHCHYNQEKQKYLQDILRVILSRE